MLGYPVTDRDHERLILELNLLTQVEPQNASSRPAPQFRWFHRSARPQGLRRVPLAGVH